MNDYLLFVDTETSGLPLDWNKPYSLEGNWPYIVQLAWIIYSPEGEVIKVENHYVKPKDFKISEISRKIHGISDGFLQEHGEERPAVMQCLYNDLMQYKPLVVGHFMQLDYHMMSLGFYRAGLPNPLPHLRTFCTMKLTGDFLGVPGQRYLRLPELYERLFRKPMQHEHNALVDARSTAECFLELRSRGDITEETIAQQQAGAKTPKAISTTHKASYVVFSMLLLLLIYLLIRLFI